MDGKRGFTLIELLVVIAIIGLLSGIVLASLSGARSKGRDAKRVADLKQLQLALQLYYDQNSSYPVGDGYVSTQLTALTTGGYISVLPSDPLTARGYDYQSGTRNSNGTYSDCASAPCNTYVLAAGMENDAGSLGGYQGTDYGLAFNSLGNVNCSEYSSPSFVYCVIP